MKTLFSFLTTVVTWSLFFALCCHADKTCDRVETSLQDDLKQIGTVKARDTKQIESSSITIGCEVFDRDFTDY